MMTVGDLAIDSTTGDIGVVLEVNKRFYKIQWTYHDQPWMVPKGNVTRLPT